MRRNFSSHTLAEIFRDLYLQEASGILHLKHGEIVKKIYFDRGLIIFAESTLEDEDLGARLVHEGKISTGALAEARRNITEPKDLAQALVNRGLLTKSTLSDTVRFLVGKIVRSVFVWEGGSAWFNEGWLLQELFEGDVVTSFEWILEGVYEMIDFGPVQETLADLKSRIELRDPLPIPLEKMKLAPTQGFILGQIDGTTSVHEVLSILPPDQEDVAARFLFTLLVMGVAELVPRRDDERFGISGLMRAHADNMAMEKAQVEMIEQTYGRFRSANPHEILALEPNADHEAIHRAYQRAKRAFAKNVLLPRLRDRYRSELAVIESRLVEAFLTLTKAQRHAAERAAAADSAQEREVEDSRRGADYLVRMDMDKSASRRAQDEAKAKADEYFGKAKRTFLEGDYHNAIQYAKLAISHESEDARFYHLLAGCQQRNPEPRWQRMAEKNYLRAIELDSWNTEYLIELAQFYKRRGLKLRARKKFEEALRISPSLKAVEAELRSLR